MLDFIVNAIYIGALTVSEINLMATQEVAPQELHAVVPVEFRAVSTIWSDVHSCRFTGVAVPVERDWEEVVDNGFVKQVLPPEPGKLYTYAIIINKKTCPGKDAEHMFSTGSWTGAFTNLGLPKGFKFMALGLSKEAERQPKWLPQVIKVVQAAAETNPVAKDFLVYNMSIAEGKNNSAPVAAKKEQ